MARGIDSSSNNAQPDQPTQSKQSAQSTPADMTSSAYNNGMRAEIVGIFANDLRVGSLAPDGK